MKKIIALILCAAMLFTACGKVNTHPQATVNAETVAISAEPTTEIAEATPELTAEPTTEPTAEPTTEPTTDPAAETLAAEYLEPQFESLDDEELLTYIENTVYMDTVAALGSDEYFVENVSAIYISKEYIEESEFNSQSNIYFGYTLAESDEVFQGTKYIFTLSDNGTTTVQELQETDEISPETMAMLKNVAIGTGVILVCATVSIVSGPLGAHAVSVIFAASAKNAGITALTYAAFGGITSGIVTGIQTGDFNDALEAAAASASEGFMFGAISGAIVGGVSEGMSLYGAAKQTSFTMNQYAQIQQETGYPLDVIKQFHTMDEYQAFRDANLKSTFVNNRSALIKTDIDPMRVDSKGRTNLDRMKLGIAPLDSDGVSLELHHVGQRKDGTLAILSQTEHDNPAIHGFLEKTEAHAAGTNWDAEKKAFWRAFAKMFG